MIEGGKHSDLDEVARAQYQQVVQQFKVMALQRAAAPPQAVAPTDRPTSPAPLNSAAGKGTAPGQQTH